MSCLLKCRWLLVLLAAGGALSVRAHDPYEITATASIQTNRIEFRAVLEYRAARLLAGLGWPTNQVNEAPEFLTMQPALEKVAAEFFRVTAAEKVLSPGAVEVSLGVENHVTFAVNFPANNVSGIIVSAPGLTALAAEGPYGTGLTVLDMVRKKVWGQKVFTSANPSATAAFGPLPGDLVVVENRGGAKPAIALPAPSTNDAASSSTGTQPAEHRPLLWPWFVAAAFGLVCAWWRRRKN